MNGQNFEQEREFTFSPLSETDLDFFNQVRNSAAPYLHDARVFSLQETRDWFSKPSPIKYWVVSLLGEKIGYFRSRVESLAVWEIGADLRPESRGKGFARAMYRQFAIAVLEPNGVELCTLRVLKANQRAFSLYLAMGFNIIEEADLDLKMEIAVGRLLEART